MSMNAINFSSSKASVKRSQAVSAAMKAEAQAYCHGAVSGLLSLREEPFRYCLALHSPDGLRTYRAFRTHTEGMEAFRKVFLDEGWLDVGYACLEEGKFSKDGSLLGDTYISTEIWRKVDEWGGPFYCEEGPYRDRQPETNLTRWEFTAE